MARVASPLESCSPALSAQTPSRGQGAGSRPEPCPPTGAGGRPSYPVRAVGARTPNSVRVLAAAPAGAGQARRLPTVGVQYAPVGGGGGLLVSNQQPTLRPERPSGHRSAGSPKGPRRRPEPRSGKGDRSATAVSGRGDFGGVEEYPTSCLCPTL